MSIIFLSGCQDSPSAECSLYNSNIICDSQGTHYLWAKENCPLYCGFCQSIYIIEFIIQHNDTNYDLKATNYSKFRCHNGLDVCQLSSTLKCSNELNKLTQMQTKLFWRQNVPLLIECYITLIYRTPNTYRTLEWDRHVHPFIHGNEEGVKAHRTHAVSLMHAIHLLNTSYAHNTKNIYLCTQSEHTNTFTVTKL